MSEAAGSGKREGKEGRERERGKGKREGKEGKGKRERERGKGKEGREREGKGTAGTISLPRTYVPYF